MTRDLSQAQYEKALRDNGWEPQGFLGYVKLNLPAGAIRCVSVLNAGTRRRDWLAYLANEQAKVSA